MGLLCRHGTGIRRHPSAFVPVLCPFPPAHPEKEQNCLNLASFFSQVFSPVKEKINLVLEKAYMRQEDFVRFSFDKEGNITPTKKLTDKIVSSQYLHKVYSLYDFLI